MGDAPGMLLMSHLDTVHPVGTGGTDGPLKFRRDGDRVEFVQDAVVLENLISKYLFSQAGSGDSNAEAPATTE
jgi:hypothetical protein